ncbi:DUF1127 domain-containing protein [Yoonia litorea]|uniref:Uncharacterized conserved protein YjiS, DUF1127 family n=1 Tax=Yoonia litorea TaxID=1123755 RepID=A0A1I6LHF4_9RHOB|nr:DUF1127 domain-containing protein [Yoonia litorea]SFS02891.1 Uncharacterized conserved protein YjiS, DUF1127 family [Yoonia litorea]
MSISVYHATQKSTASGISRLLPGAIIKMFALARQRRALDELPDHLLEDIGKTRVEAAKEAARAPWDVPAYWRG